MTSTVIALRSSEICKQIPGLSPQQRSICQTRPNSIIYVSEGIELAMSECKWQFRNSKWNCTTGGRSTSYKSKAKFATKEKAFESAIRSAGILHAIVTACGRGLLRDCGCAVKRGYFRARRRAPKTVEAQEPVHTWRWGGCSADITYGLNFTSNFLNAGETRRNEDSLMNLHNQKTGRIIVAKRLKRTCRCHGVSGSCTLKTCWITLPTFREVGNIIRKRYGVAKKVIPLGQGAKGRARYLKIENPRRNSYVKPPLGDLIYLQTSPSYCERNFLYGVPGTRGRQCHPAESGEQNCENMCCRRGFRTVHYQRHETCKCKFFWCCTVRCELCVTNATKHVCE